MKIGADKWLAISFREGEEQKRADALAKHKRERVDNGYSWYDWICADDYICGVIASIARKFRLEGCGYPAHMSLEKWNDILERIEKPLLAYVNREPVLPPAEENRLSCAASEALHLFADNFQGFWD